MASQLFHHELRSYASSLLDTIRGGTPVLSADALVEVCAAQASPSPLRVAFRLERFLLALHKKGVTPRVLFVEELDEPLRISPGNVVDPAAALSIIRDAVRMHLAMHAAVLEGTGAGLDDYELSQAPRSHVSGCTATGTELLLQGGSDQPGDAGLVHYIRATRPSGFILHAPASGGGDDGLAAAVATPGAARQDALAAGALWAVFAANTPVVSLEDVTPHWVHGNARVQVQWPRQWHPAGTCEGAADPLAAVLAQSLLQSRRRLQARRDALSAAQVGIRANWLPRLSRLLASTAPEEACLRAGGLSVLANVLVVAHALLDADAVTVVDARTLAAYWAHACLLPELPLAARAVPAAFMRGNAQAAAAQAVLARDLPTPQRLALRTLLEFATASGGRGATLPVAFAAAGVALSTGHVCDLYDAGVFAALYAMTGDRVNSPSLFECAARDVAARVAAATAALGPAAGARFLAGLAWLQGEAALLLPPGPPNGAARDGCDGLLAAVWGVAGSPPAVHPALQWEREAAGAASAAAEHIRRRLFLHPVTASHCLIDATLLSPAHAQRLRAFETPETEAAAPSSRLSEVAAEFEDVTHWHSGEPIATGASAAALAAPARPATSKWEIRRKQRASVRARVLTQSLIGGAVKQVTISASHGDAATAGAQGGGKHTGSGGGGDGGASRGTTSVLMQLMNELKSWEAKVDAASATTTTTAGNKGAAVAVATAAAAAKGDGGSLELAAPRASIVVMIDEVFPKGGAKARNKKQAEDLAVSAARSAAGVAKEALQAAQKAPPSPDRERDALLLAVGKLAGRAADAELAWLSACVDAKRGAWAQAVSDTRQPEAAARAAATAATSTMARAEAERDAAWELYGAIERVLIAVVGAPPSSSSAASSLSPTASPAAPPSPAPTAAITSAQAKAVERCVVIMLELGFAAEQAKWAAEWLVATAAAAAADKSSRKHGGSSSGSSSIPSAAAAATAALRSTAPLLARDSSAATLPRFQLAHMGAKLSRTSGVGADPRLSFVPDVWQKRLLDVVDAGESALVVAPTSCGKTFISFYAAERVLRSSDPTATCVMVVPTVALVNQLVADVSARFCKDYGTRSDMELVGHFTADDRSARPGACQVLVTVPECLEIMLLGLEGAEWAARIRYVIADEVHNILGEQGHVWERLLLLSDAPLLALSATIGEPTRLHAWLARVSAAQRPPRRVHLIRFDDEAETQLIPRYSFLYYYVHHGGLPGAAIGGGADSIASGSADGNGQAPATHRGDDTSAVATLAPPSSLAEAVWRLAASTADPAALAALPVARGAALGNERGDGEGEEVDSDSEEEADEGEGGEVTALAAAEVADVPHPSADDPLVRAATREAEGVAATALFRAPPPLTPLNPVSLVRPEQLATDDSDAAALALKLPLLPSHALQLFDAVSSAVKAEIASHSSPPALMAYLQQYLSPLEPERVFAGLGFKRMSLPAAREYGTRTVAALLALGDASPALAARVLSAVSAPVPGLRLPSSHVADEQSFAVVPRGRLPALTAALQQSGKLPAIVFHFSRAKCVSLARELLEASLLRHELYRRSRKFLEDSEVRQKQLAEVEDAIKRGAAQAARAKGTEQREAAARDLAELQGVRGKLDGWLTREVLPEFAYGGTHGLPSEPEMEELLPAYLKATVPSELRAMLRHGVGVHHANLAKAYRAAVEVLFRRGKLGLIVSTSTLSQGIHMPCRTVVFAGDSNYLTPSLFHQMAGRAGRRGLDLVGHVVFLGISTARVQHLMLAPHAAAAPSFPITTSYVLRLMLRARQLLKAELGAGGGAGPGTAKGAAAAATAVALRSAWAGSCSRLVAHSQLAALEPAAAAQSALHLRYSLELLQTMGVASGTGVPLAGAGLVSRLAWAEPGGMLVHSLLRSGLLARFVAWAGPDHASAPPEFARLCRNGSTAVGGFQAHSLPRPTLAEARTDNALLALMSLLFLREYPVRQDRATVNDAHRLSLGSLDEETRAQLSTHNATTLEVLARYLSVYAASGSTRCCVEGREGGPPVSDPTLGPDADATRRLPLTRVAVGAVDCVHRQLGLAPDAGTGGVVGATTASPSPWGSLGTRLRAIATPSLVRSPFAALGGVPGGDKGGDEFASLQELCSDLRDDVAIDPVQVPTLYAAGEDVTSAAVDYYGHWNWTKIEAECGFDRDEAYSMLLSLSKVLKVLAEGMRVYVHLRREAAAGGGGDGEGHAGLHADGLAAEAVRGCADRFAMLVRTRR